MKNPVLHDWSKHIDVKFHFLRDCVDGEQIVIEFVETGRQLADILTKPLGCIRLTKLKEMIGMEGIQGIVVGLWEELLDNLLLPCVNTQQWKATPKKALCCGTVAAARADAERLTCLTVALAGTGAEVSYAVLSSHCCSRTAVLGLDE